MKRIVCIFMAAITFALCFALWSCEGAFSPKETKTQTKTQNKTETKPATIVGTWTMTIPGVKLLFSGDEWDTDGHDWKGDINLSLAFYDSGSLVLGLNKSDTREFIKNNLVEINALFGYTMEEVMKEGQFETEDEVIDAMLSTFTSANKNGKYTYSDGVLSTELVSLTHTHGKDEKEVPSEIKVEVTGDKLTFTEYVTDGGDNNLFDADILPLTFSRHG